MGWGGSRAAHNRCSAGSTAKCRPARRICYHEYRQKRCGLQRKVPTIHASVLTQQQYRYAPGSGCVTKPVGKQGEGCSWHRITRVRHTPRVGSNSAQHQLNAHAALFRRLFSSHTSSSQHHPEGILPTTAVARQPIRARVMPE